MYKKILLSLLSTLFIGCSSTSALKHFEVDELKSRAVQHTKKADIKDENKQVEIMFWATYLNNIKKLDLNNETFLISVYKVNNKNHNLLNNGYEIYLETSGSKKKITTKQAIKVTKIDRNDVIYNSIINDRPWGNHYIVEFENAKKDYKLNLVYKDKNFVKEDEKDINPKMVQLKFEK